jgi:hypothetical protein
VVPLIADGYRATDLVYEWDKVRPVVVEQNVELSQYQLVNKTTEHFPKFLRGVGKLRVFCTNAPCPLLV